MRLLPGSTPPETADALERCLEGLAAARSGWSSAASRGDAESLRDGYLRWAETAEAQLAGLSEDDVLVAGLFTVRWSEIRALTAGSPRPVPLVNGEAAFQRARLERALREAQALAAPVMPAATADPSAVRAVVDTNVYLHYSVFDRPWPAALGAPAVRLVVPLVVLRELDVHKNRGGALGRRAAQAASRVLGLTSDGAAKPAPLAESVSLEVVHDPPGHDPRRHADVELLDRAAALSATPGGPVVVVTGDAGVKVSARARGLGYAAPPEAWRLPDADPVAKENERLKAEAAAAAAARPRLAVVFAATDADHWQPIEVEVPAPVAELEAARAQEELPVRPRQPYSLGSYAFEISNDDRRAWHREVAEWADELDARRAARARAVKLDLAVTNTGRAAAGDVELVLTAPEGHAFLADEDLADTDRPPPPRPALLVRPEYDLELDVERDWHADGQQASAHLRLVRQGGGSIEFGDPVWLVRLDGQAAGGTPVAWKLRGTTPAVQESGTLHVLPRPGQSAGTPADTG